MTDVYRPEWLQERQNIAVKLSLNLFAAEVNYQLGYSEWIVEFAQALAVRVAKQVPAVVVDNKIVIGEPEAAGAPAID